MGDNGIVRMVGEGNGGYGSKKKWNWNADSIRVNNLGSKNKWEPRLRKIMGDGLHGFGWIRLRWELSMGGCLFN